MHIVRMARGCRIELPLSTGEIIYGLGLQCKHLEQNGWRKTLFAASGDNNGKGMSHAPVPFYVSTAGYGVLVDSARYLTYSVGEKQRLAGPSAPTIPSQKSQIITDINLLYGPEKRDETSIYVDVPSARGVDVYLFAGPDMGQAIARYNLFSGGGCMPALTGLGPGYIFGTMLDGKSILGMCDQLQRDRMPVTSTGLEPGWQTHAYSSSYMWNRDKFPADFLATMRQKGYDVNLWCQMYVDPSSPLMPLLGSGFGDFEVWRGVVPDLADQKIRDAYRDFLAKNFISKGVSGFKLDEVDGSCNNSSAYQEWQFPEFTSFPSGADGEQMRNLLGRFGLQAMDEAFRKENRRTYSKARASQAWAAPLSVAIYSDEYDFSDYLRYNLSAGVQGLLWAPEIRHADNEKEWALRIGAAAFSARMLYNAWQFPNFPWQQPNLGENEQNHLLQNENPYLKTARYFNNLRMALIPYLYQAYGDYHRKGIAPLRPLVADWATDANTWHIDDQWMLGSDLLVAPITHANSFETCDLQSLGEATRFEEMNGSCRISVDGDAIKLDADFNGDGIKGAKTSLELHAGSCSLRFSYRADVGKVGLRMWTPEGREVGEFHNDETAPSAQGWQICDLKAQLPVSGKYVLYFGKAHASTGARHIAFRNFTIFQKSAHNDDAKSWSREMYLPQGDWCDFWTGKVLKGGGYHVITATPQRVPVFVREGTLMPLAEPLVTVDAKSVFNIHLMSFGGKPRPCHLLEDDGVTFAYENGTWATVTLGSDGTVRRPDHGQPQRYRVIAGAQDPPAVIARVLGTGQ